VTDTSTTRPRGRTGRRKLIGLPAFFLLAAVVGSASLAGLAGAISPTGEEQFDAATWKPTLEAPLPPMDGPLTFNLSDEPAYWYDNGRPDLEGILHTRSLAAGVAGVPTKVKFEVAEPYTSENHTVSSIVWPVGAKNVPFLQQGSFTGTPVQQSTETVASPDRGTEKRPHGTEELGIAHGIQRLDLVLDLLFAGGEVENQDDERKRRYDCDSDGHRDPPEVPHRTVAEPSGDAGPGRKRRRSYTIAA
jgi:hypothetical protein